MRSIAPRLAAMVLFACLHVTTWACSSRAPAASGPAQPPAASPPDASTAVAAPEQPPAAPENPAETEISSDECEVIREAGELVSTVALTERVSPWNAPYPTNDSERLLFRQLYDTLVRVDCMGRALPGLAASWRLDGDGRRWIITLDENARYSDGTQVTAADVRSAWSQDGVGDGLRPAAARLIESIAAVDDHTLAITLRSRRTDAPLSLAHTDLAIAKPASGSSWPVGTRRAHVASADEKSLPGGSVLTVVRENLPPIRFVVAPGDPRDLLDMGVDLLVTRDPAALGYAATLPQFQSLPLEWQRTYVLLAPGRSRASPSLSPEARQMLAADAVRGEARGAEGPFWWEMPADCEVARVAPSGPSSLSPRIVYDSSDRAARELAERLVALVRAGPDSTALLDALLPDRPRRTYQRAAGLANEALALAWRRGADAGYIAAVDRRPLDPCRDLEALMERARWLDPETVVPLVETRLHAVVRRGRSGVTAEWDGGLVLAGAKAAN